jgi:WD40 repeat protein
MDSALLATSAANGNVEIWDAQTWRRISQLSAKPRHVGFSSVSGLLAYSEGGNSRTSFGRVTIYDYPAGHRIQRLDRSGSRFAFTPDGSTLVTGGEGYVTVWDTATWTQRWSVVRPASPLHLAVSPDGTKFAGCNFVGGVEVFDVNDSTRSKALAGQGSRVFSLAFSPDGTRLAGGGSDQLIQLWDVSTWETMSSLPRTLRGHGHAVRALAFDPTGQWLVSGDRSGHILIWNIDTPVPATELTNVLVTYTNLPPVFSRDGKWIAARRNAQSFAVWTAARLDEVQEFQNSAMPIGILGNDQVVATFSGRGLLQFWDLRGGVLRRTVEVASTEDVFSAAISQDGGFLALGGMRGALALWDTTSGQRVWQSQVHQSTIRQTSFSRDERLLGTASEDFLAKVLDAATGKQTAVLDGHTDQVFSIAFSPDGQTVATGSIDDTARLWNIQTGKLLATLAGHKEGVFHVAFSRDGQTLATASDDQTVRLWDVETQRELARLDHPSAVVSVGFTPDDQALVTASLDNTIHVWRAPWIAGRTNRKELVRR